MSHITWGEQILDSFISNTIKKAEELSGLEFHLSAFHTDETLNLDDDVTYFIPLENTYAAGFFYLGLSKKHLDDFVQHALFRLSLMEKEVKQAISPEQVLVEFARDLYTIPDTEHGEFQKIENFFTESKVDTNFVKFEGNVKRDCLYFELANEEFGVLIKCKCMFYEKE